MVYEWIIFLKKTIITNALFPDRQGWTGQDNCFAANRLRSLHVSLCRVTTVSMGRD